MLMKMLLTTIMMMMTYGSGSLQSVSSKMAFKVPSQPVDDDENCFAYNDDNVLDDADDDTEC